MEIGQKVYWNIGDKIIEGLFIQINEDNKAEIICYSMNKVKCKLRVFVDLSLLKINND